MTSEELEMTNGLRLQRDQKAARIEELEAALAAEQKVAQIAEGRNFDLSLEVPKLEAALAEARKDGERLDKLEALMRSAEVGNGVALFPLTSTVTGVPLSCVSIDELGEEDGSNLGAEVSVGPTLRAAIDAARGTR